MISDSITVIQHECLHSRSSRDALVSPGTPEAILLYGMFCAEIQVDSMMHAKLANMHEYVGHNIMVLLATSADF